MNTGQNILIFQTVFSKCPHSQSLRFGPHKGRSTRTHTHTHTDTVVRLLCSGNSRFYCHTWLHQSASVHTQTHIFRHSCWVTPTDYFTGLRALSLCKHSNTHTHPHLQFSPGHQSHTTSGIIKSCVCVCVRLSGCDDLAEPPFTIKAESFIRATGS